MNYVTHFIHPNQTEGSAFVRMLCGRLKHSRTEEIKTSDDPDKVTCTKCLGYKDNPARLLRQYGQVLLTQPYCFVLVPAWGYQFQIVAMKEDNSESWKYIANTGKDIFRGEFNVSSFKDAIRYIIGMIENQFIKSEPLCK